MDTALEHSVQRRRSEHRPLRTGKLFQQVFEAGRPLHWSAEAGVTGYMIVEAAVGFHCAFLNSAIGFLKRGRPRHATTAAGSPAPK